MSGRPPELPPQAPVGGFFRRLLGPFYVTGVFWYRFHLFGVRLLPSWLMAPFIGLFTTFFFVFLLRIRRAIGRNLEAVLGPCGPLARQARIFRTMRTFAWCLTEFYEQLGTGRRTEVSIEGEEIWRQLTGSDAGAILVTAHIGHWDLGSMVPAERGGRQVHVVREREMDPRAQEFLERHLAGAEGGSVRFHFAGLGDHALGIELLRALRDGHWVALQSDRPRTGARTVEVTLFGRRYELPAGPLVLARSAGVPIVPIFLFREGRLRARAVVRPPIRVAKRGSREPLVEARRVAEELEWAIAREPHQWFCFRELWP